MTNQRRSLGVLAGLVFALMTAPAAAATGSASGQLISEAKAGIDAAADAHVDAHVDASGAVDTAEDVKANAREELNATYGAVVEIQNEAQADANETAQDAEGPQTDAQARVRATAETVNRIEARHHDEANESAQARTEPVDAGADAGVIADVSAFLEGTGDVLVEAAGTVDDAGEAAEQMIAAKVDAFFSTTSQAEGKVTAAGSEALGTQADGPDVEPEASVEGDASSVTEVTAEGRHEVRGDADADR